MWIGRPAAFSAIGIILLVGCDSAAMGPATAPTVLLGAGDIADCSSSGDEETAAMLGRMEGTVFTVGDNAYEEGSRRDFLDCYESSWGRLKERTRPSLGNHEYYTGNAQAYFDYFGAKAGASSDGYYSYDHGAWHVVVLNSNFQYVNDERQEAWLVQDLRGHSQRCTLAYFHHPRFSSGEHGDQLQMWPIWDILYDHGVDVVISGHDHDYERFAPQTPAGEPDAVRGIRQFIVGTGGDELRGFPSTSANSEFRYNKTFGVIRLVLRAESYGWEFLAAPAGRVMDAGEGQCH